MEEALRLAEIAKSNAEVPIRVALGNEIVGLRV